MKQSVMEKREKYYYEVLEKYKKKSEEDERYKMTYEKFKNGKENFMLGWTIEQVVKGRDIK